MTSDQTSEQKADLGPQPEPEIEPREPNPGGVDAVDQDDSPPTVADLTPEENPAIEDHAPDELSETEDTDTAATESAGDDAAEDKGESSG